MPQTYVEMPHSGMVIRTDRPDLFPEGTKLRRAEGERRARAYAVARLHTLLKPGDTIYTVLRHVSASGMSRRIDLYAIGDNKPLFLSGYAADVLGIAKPAPERPGLRIDGGGMDMGFDLVYRLAEALFNDGTMLRQAWL